MKFDLYLSEMSISNLHGGGLTLQRILGDDLMQIPYFAYLNRFAYDLAANPKFAGRDINLTSIWENNTVRSGIGRSLAFTINNQPFIIKRAAKKNARILNSKFEKSKAINVLVCPQGLSSICTLEELKKHRRVKYVTWVMDDHLIKYVNGGWTYPKGVESIFKKHLDEAEHVFVISPALQSFYKQRFAIESTVLFGPADYSQIRLQPKYNPANSFKLGYFGAVAAWQLDVLISVAHVLHITNTQLDIYSGIKQLPDELNLDGVHLKAVIDPGGIMETMSNYDALLLPISFLETTRNMSEFNIATKMSEYLASGVPVLAVGPAYAAMIKYLKSNNAAIVVESGEPAAITNAFKDFGDPHKISEILLNAKNLVANETGLITMRKRWTDALNKLSS